MLKIADKIILKAAKTDKCVSGQESLSSNYLNVSRVAIVPAHSAEQFVRCILYLFP